MSYVRESIHTKCEIFVEQAFKNRAEDCQYLDYGADDYLDLLEMVFNNDEPVIQVLDGQPQDGVACLDENDDLIYLWRELRFDNEQQLLLWATRTMASLVFHLFR